MDNINYEIALARLDEAERIYAERRPLRQWRQLAAAGTVPSPERGALPKPRGVVQLILGALR